MSEKKSYTLDDFTILSVIGKGIFGKIFLVRENTTSKIYSLKALKKKLLQEQNKVQNIFTERVLLTKVIILIAIKGCERFIVYPGTIF